MDLSINYPYGIPFYANMTFIPVYFTNNDSNLYTIYFVKHEKVTNLAGIIFPNEKNKKYHFPEKSMIAIILEKKPNDIQCYIKLRKDWLYVYP